MATGGEGETSAPLDGGLAAGAGAKVGMEGNGAGTKNASTPPPPVNTSAFETESEADSSTAGSPASPQQRVPTQAQVDQEQEDLTESTQRIASALKDRVFPNTEAALQAAETVRQTGNVAFSAGSLANALTLYEVALRHLNEARKLQTAEQQMSGEYGDRMWKCMQACHLNSAMCNLKLEKWQDCVDCCNIILQAEENCVKALYRSGVSYSAMGMHRDAVQRLLKAHDLAPDDVTITRDLAKAIGKQKKTEADPMKELARNMFKSNANSGTKESGTGQAVDESMDASEEGVDTDHTHESSEEDEDEDDGEWESEDEEDDDDEYEDEDEEEEEEDGDKGGDGVFRFTGLRDELDEAFKGAQKMQDELESVKSELEEMWHYARELRAEHGDEDEVPARDTEAAIRGASGAGAMEEDEGDFEDAALRSRWDALDKRERELLQKGAKPAPAPKSAPAAAPRPDAAAKPAAAAAAPASASSGTVVTGESDEMSPIEMAAESCKKRGNEAFGAQRTGTALTEYSEAITMAKLRTFNKPKLAAIYYSNRAAVYMRLERYAEAAADCAEAMRLDGSFWKAARRGGQALLKLGDYDESVRCLEAALAQAGEAAPRELREEIAGAQRLQRELQKVHQLLESGDAPRALQCVRSLASECSQEGTVLRVLQAKVLMRCSKFDEAQALIKVLRSEGALDMRTEQDLNHLQAKALVGMARIAEANRMLRDLLRRDPDNEAYKTDLKRARAMSDRMEEGDTATRLERFEEARSAYSEAMALDPSNLQFKARMLCSRAAAFEKQRTKAIQAETELDEAKSEVKEAQEALEAAQRRLIKGHDRLKTASRTSERVKAEFEADEESHGSVQDPAAPFLQNTTADVQAKWALYCSIEDACAALDLDPTCAAALITRARCMSKIGDLSEAVADYERAQQSESLDRHEFPAHVISQELKNVQAKLKAAPISHYKMLGLAETATVEEVKKAYKRLAIKYHPDKQSRVGRELGERMGRRFNQISEAHTVLSNPTEKRLYDMKQRRSRGGGGGVGGGFGGGGHSGFGGGRSYGGRSYGYGGMFGSDDEDGW